MKRKLLLPMMIGAALCGWAVAGYAQSHVSTVLLKHSVQAAVMTGTVSGRVEDPTGAVVANARVTIRNPASGWGKSGFSNRRGIFRFAGLPAGIYQVKVRAKGFRAATLRNIRIADGSQIWIRAALSLAQVSTRIQVAPSSESDWASSVLTVNQADRNRSSNAAELLANIPGVSLRGNGQLGSVPMLHGLGDERTKLVVNGMSISNSCPDHMNPPLSYIAPANVEKITVMAGITPVSMGGDSLGGTISVQSPSPVFAAQGQPVVERGNVSSFYRSNGEDYGVSTSEWIAGHYFGIGYAGSWVTNSDYTDGAGHKVTSTYAQSTDAMLTLAAKDKDNLVVLRAGLHHIPYQGFVNARMDMVRNYATSLNLDYRRMFKHAVLDIRGYWQSSSHSMNIGHDKSMFPMAMSMPMNDHGADTGYSVKYEVPLSSRHRLRIGNEFHRFVLNDSWSPVAGNAPMMGPDSFVNINNGRRTRLGAYAELTSRWNRNWTTLLGVRNDTVWSSAGPVHGYSAIYDADADAFNAADRARTNVDFDVTAATQYKLNPHADIELGYARKSRAPSLYERYEWSTSMTTSSMVGWFGDGNYYVGNVNLKPETAHTFSGTVRLHGRSNAVWNMKVTPYVTRIHDYIDVDTLMTVTQGMSTFAQLRFANHPAMIYGGNLSGDVMLWRNTDFGSGRLSATGGWLHGERLDTHTGLYEMMPLHLHLSLNDAVKGWSGGVGMYAVDRKSNVDPHRLEQPTPGYTLFNVHTAYRCQHLELSAMVNNLLNKEYEMPLGGLNMDVFLASGSMGQIEPVTGRGRSAGFSMTVRF